MRGDHRFRTLVARERGERFVARLAESHRMAAFAAVKRCHDRRAVGEGRHDARDRCRRDPRHVGERDDPCGGIRRGSHRAREACAHPRRRRSRSARRARRRLRAPQRAQRSSGRTTAITSGIAASKCRADAAPMHSPAMSLAGQERAACRCRSGSRARRRAGCRQCGKRGTDRAREQPLRRAASRSAIGTCRPSP